MSNFKPLPFTNETVFIDEKGNLKDNKERKINHKFGYVKIKDWVTDEPVNVWVLVIYTFQGLKLPVKYWKFIKINKIFPNKDLCLNNIYYTYNNPIQSEEYPDFYYIPYYNRYLINKKGQIFSLIRNKFKSIAYSARTIKGVTGGYGYTRVKDDSERSCCILLHRALALTFIKPKSFHEFLAINHIDGNPGNNSISNLEWCTWAENNQHAYNLGLKPNSAKVINAKNLVTGQEWVFPSISECARKLGYKHQGLIAQRLRFSKNKIFKDKMVFKYSDEDWPDYVLNGQIKICNLGGAPLLAKNIFTGLVVLFNSALEASQELELCSASILNILRANNPIPIKGYNFQYVHSQRPWPVHSEKHMRIYSQFPLNPKNGYEVFDTETGVEEFFTSSHAVLNKFNISKGVLSYLCKTGKIFKGKRFKMFDIRKSYGPSDQK